MKDHRGPFAPARQSGSRFVRSNPSPELARVLARHPRRWAAATQAAAMALSPQARTTELEWLDLLEALEDAIHRVVYS